MLSGKRLEYAKDLTGTLANSRSARQLGRGYPAITKLRRSQHSNYTIYIIKRA